jgi:hypothetical protein
MIQHNGYFPAFQVCIYSYINVLSLKTNCFNFVLHKLPFFVFRKNNLQKKIREAYAITNIQPLIFSTEVNKISGYQGGLASNKFSANEVPGVERTGTLSFFLLRPPYHNHSFGMRLSFKRGN